MRRNRGLIITAPHAGVWHLVVDVCETGDDARVVILWGLLRMAFSCPYLLALREILSRRLGNELSDDRGF